MWYNTQFSRALNQATATWHSPIYSTETYNTATIVVSSDWAATIKIKWWLWIDNQAQRTSPTFTSAASLTNPWGYIAFENVTSWATIAWWTWIVNSWAWVTIAKVNLMNLNALCFEIDNVASKVTVDVLFNDL